MTINASNCPHSRKTYRDVILTSNPPQHPWICPDCFQEGAEMRWSRRKQPEETYEEVIKRKHETLLRD